MTLDSATHSTDARARRPQPGRYRPAFLPGLGAAVVLFVAVYWLFLAFQLQEVDLNQPPVWWLRQTETFPLLALIPIRFVTFVDAALSWVVFRHILIPGLIGWWLAGQVATGFVRSFYNFNSTAEAGSFLSRLQQHRSDRGPTGGAPAATQRSSTTGSGSGGRQETASTKPGAAGRTRMKPAVMLTLITLPFAGTFVLLLFFSWLMPPSPTRSTVYSLLIVVLGAIWVAVVALYSLETMSGGGSSPPGLMLDRERLQMMRNDHALLRVGGPGRIFVPNSDVVVTEYNGHFCRVLGPGVQTLLPFEYVRSMLDLRQQERDGEVSGVTQDGVVVACHVAVTFRLSKDDRYFSSEDALNQAPTEDPRRSTPERPYPFGQRAVREAAYSEAVDGEGRVSTWTSAPLMVATGQLRNALAQNRLEALFDPEARNREAHPQLLQWLQESTRSELLKWGITLISLRMGPLRPPETVSEQNLSGWRSFWEKEYRKQEAEGRAAATSAVERARTEAQVEMLRAIAEGIQRARRESSVELAREIVALRLIEALERLAHSAHEAVAEGGTQGAGRSADEKNSEVIEQLERLRRELAPPRSDASGA